MYNGPGRYTYIHQAEWVFSFAIFEEEVFDMQKNETLFLFVASFQLHVSKAVKWLIV